MTLINSLIFEEFVLYLYKEFRNNQKKIMDFINSDTNPHNSVYVSDSLHYFDFPPNEDEDEDELFDDDLLDARLFSRKKKKPIFSKHKKWTKEEDSKLLKMVVIFGAKDWRNLSKHMEGRNSRQCRERWQNYLNPNLNFNNWTLEEDKLLLEMREKHGPKWKLISKYFTNRTDAMIKNRYNALERIGKKKNQIDCDKHTIDSDHS